MRCIILVLMTAGFAFGEDAEDIVRKAIEATAPVPKEQPPEPQIERVIRKANGDVETIYVIPGKGRAAITEESTTKGVPDDRTVAVIKKTESKISLDNLFVIVNDKKYGFKGLTPESANTALAKEGGVPVFVTENNAVIEPPPWYTGPKSSVKRVIAAPALPPPQATKAMLQTSAKAPQVAQGFPTIRPTLVQDVGQSSVSSPVTTQAEPTITYAAAVGPGGNTKGCKT